ncbi:hypothetical protein SAMN04489841_1056 [Natrinema salaciae]|uniref:Uncharacterized protein n=1 Tax=Natrinema salaciae TaxID=1186196 RepID=A0A1H9CHY1_9EURY|nr:hypothetical protein SAMN04489841_1056 [Natrinema salaciae]
MVKVHLICLSLKEFNHPTIKQMQYIGSRMHRKQVSMPQNGFKGII